MELVGIRSAQAANPSYNIIVVGGPIYAGKASTSVQTYLSSLKPAESTRVGVFATGCDPDTAKDEILLRKEVTSLPENSTLQIKAVTKFISSEYINKKSADFVNTLLQ